MIKKLLVFVSVLALAQAASAVSVSLVSGGESTLTLGVDITIGQTIQVDLICDVDITSIYYIDFLSGPGNTIPALGAWQPPMDSPNFPGIASGGDIIDAGASATAGSPAAAGTVLYSFNAIINGTGVITPYMSASDYILTPTVYGNNITQNVLHIVPEPVTIVLFTLGGLS